MNEADCHEQAREPERVIKSVEMSLSQRTIFLVKPFVLAFLSLPFFLISAFVLFFYFPHIKPVDKYGLMAAIVIFLLSSVLLLVSASAFAGMARRKMQSGRFLPTGEELTKLRLSNQRSPLWKKIAIPAPFCIIAIGATHSFLAPPHYGHLSMWIIPVLMWIAAVLIVLRSFLPSEPKWMLPALAVVWGTAGAYYAVGVVASRSRGAEYWEFPALMLVISAFAAIAAIRSRLLAPKPADSMGDPESGMQTKS